MSTVDYSTIVSVDKVTGYQNVDDTAYRVIRTPLIDVPYEAGSGADATVTVTVKTPTLSSKFMVMPVTKITGVSAVIKNKTTSSFDVELKPPAGGTLAAGTVDLEVVSFESYK
jgi:hypothetical protein